MVACGWEATMSNRGTAAIELGAVIALFVGLAIAKSAYDGARAPVTQPLSRAQSLLSATEVRRLSDLQQLNKYFLQNWRERPTRPNLD
jgi:hypothetical protein